MSDSLPPTGGPDPLDGWDLEGLLSGESVWLPDGMRPVAATLAALRDAPTRSELAGEASARASFRQVMLAGASEPGRDGNGNTLILPARGANAGSHAVTRPRHARRRPARRTRWQSRVLAGAAAAVAVVFGGIALAGGFSGTERDAGTPARTAGAAGTATRGAGVNGGSGLGSATKEPTAHPARSASGQQSSGPDSGSWHGLLCRQYWALFAHPESPASWAAEKASLRELSRLAGSPWNVNRYCMPYYQWGFAPPALGGNPGNDQGGSGPQGPGNPQGNDQPASHPGNGNNGGGDSGNNAGNGNSGNGNGNNGNNGNGNGNGSHGDASHSGGGNQR